MFKQYINNNQQHYNNHCTESAIEFIPDVCDAQCYHDCADGGDADYDSLEEWVESRIDMYEEAEGYLKNDDALDRVRLEFNLACEAFDSRALHFYLFNTGAFESQCYFEGDLV